MKQLSHVAACLAMQLDTPRSLTTEILWRYGELSQLQRLRIDPSHYLTAESYHKDVIATDFVRKLAMPSSNEQRFQAAVDGFLASEKINWRTNNRLYRFIDNRDLNPSDEPVIAFVGLWRKEVDSVLGALPASLTPRFSGGATVSDRKSLSTIPDKMTSHPTLYPGSVDLLPLWWGTAWGRTCASPDDHQSFRHPKVVRANRFFTVPKDAEKDRGCCMEASLSLSYQLDVGKVVGSRLNKAYGNDLRTGKERHMAMARVASLTGSHATIDLTDASNRLARALPELVLSNQWHELFDSLRAPNVDIDGRVLRLEMFSSMGNGYTFELETLLFQTLCVTIAKQRGFSHHDVMVFGDDIIVPTAIADDCLAALRYFGFEPNSRKTFVTGPFRESCGGDFFNGQAVRPIHVKSPPTEPQHWISIANALWRLPQEWVSKARMECFKNIPAEIRSCQGPESLGDVVLHGPAQYWKSRSFRPRSERGYREEVDVTHYRAYRPVSVAIPWHHWWPSTILASALAGVDSNGPVPTGSVTGHLLCWIPAPGNAWLPTAT